MTRRSCSRIVVVVCAFAFVGTIGFAGSTAAATSAGQAAAAAPVAKAVTSAVNVNTATKEMLMAIPGIDDAQAQKIIDGRPYQSRTELTKRKIMPLELYNKISGKITTKVPKK